MVDMKAVSFSTPQGTSNTAFSSFSLNQFLILQLLQVYFEKGCQEIQQQRMYYKTILGSGLHN